MNERIINLTLAGCTDKKISEITGLSVNKIHAINCKTRAEMYNSKVEEAKQLRRKGYTHREIADMMNISSGTAFNYTSDTPKEPREPSNMLEFKKEWNAVCRRLNPKAWEDKND